MLKSQMRFSLESLERFSSGIIRNRLPIKIFPRFLGGILLKIPKEVVFTIPKRILFRESIQNPEKDSHSEWDILQILRDFSNPERDFPRILRDILLRILREIFLRIQRGITFLISGGILFWLLSEILLQILIGILLQFLKWLWCQCSLNFTKPASESWE